MVFSPKHCRLTEHCTPRTFKQLLMCATQHHPTLSAEEIADRAGIPLKWLYDYANEGQPNRNIPAVKLQRVVEVTGRIDLFRFLLAPLGHSVSPTREGVSDDHLRDKAMDIAAEAGEVAKFTRKALANDGVVDDEERVEGAVVVSRLENYVAEYRNILQGAGRVPVRIVSGGGR